MHLPRLPHQRQRRLLPFVLVASLAGLAGVLATSRAADDKKSMPARPALTVTTARPETARLPLRLNANGNVAAWQEALIGSESNGLRLEEVLVNVGDTVKAGQVLARFDAATVQADIAQARAALQEAQANAVAAQGDVARARALASSGALSAQQVAQYEAAGATAAARVAAARATLAQQGLRLKYATVVAPDAGVISARAATVGAVAGVGTELFRMIRRGRLEWRAEVTSGELPRIRPGMKAAVLAADGAEVTGTVRALAPTVDAQSRIALVYVDLPAARVANGALRAGMFASGHFDLGESGALTVPQQAVALRDGFAYVFRLNPDSRVSQVKVTTGRRLGERIEIVSGLGPDATIVAGGAGFLNDGDLVRNATAAGTTTTTTTPAPARGPASAAR
jgi:RND family efflux transporter MFP subunit